MSLADARRLARWCPAWSDVNPTCRARTEREKARAETVAAGRYGEAGCSASSDLLVVHPFQMLSGHRVPVLQGKRRAGRVVFACEGGPSGRVTVPDSWTDRGPVPVGHRLSVQALSELRSLLAG